jgi:hypothetical protein
MGHILISTVTRLRRNTFATLLALSTGGLLGGRAASADQSPEPVASATEAGPAAVVTESASPSAAEEPAGSVLDGFGIPTPAGKPVISPNGSYMQSTISDDDPAMQLNPGLVDPSANEYPRPRRPATRGSASKRDGCQAQYRPQGHPQPQKE